MKMQIIIMKMLLLVIIREYSCQEGEYILEIETTTGDWASNELGFI